MIVEFTIPVMLTVALGGALGAVVRLLADAYVPAGVLLVNTTGSLALGVLLGITAAGSITWSEPGLALVSMGFIGALSTFSTVSIRAAQLWITGYRLAAAGLWLAHSGCGLAAAAAGAWLGWVLPL